MRNEKLRGVFEGLRLRNVQSVIASGNVLFETGSTNVERLERAVEKAIQEKLGFKSATFIRSLEQLQSLLDRNPFQGFQDTSKSSFHLAGIYDQAICSVIDLTSEKTPDLMLWLEREFGKEITTRTWNTIIKIVKKLQV